jgi:hypothetical protein
MGRSPPSRSRSRSPSLTDSDQEAYSLSSEAPPYPGRPASATPSSASDPGTGYSEGDGDSSIVDISSVEEGETVRLPKINARDVVLLDDDAFGQELILELWYVGHNTEGLDLLPAARVETKIWEMGRPGKGKQPMRPRFAAESVRELVLPDLNIHAGDVMDMRPVHMAPDGNCCVVAWRSIPRAAYAIGVGNAKIPLYEEFSDHTRGVTTGFYRINSKGVHFGVAVRRVERMGHRSAPDVSKPVKEMPFIPSYGDDGGNAAEDTDQDDLGRRWAHLRAQTMKDKGSGSCFLFGALAMCCCGCLGWCCLLCARPGKERATYCKGWCSACIVCVIVLVILGVVVNLLAPFNLPA